MKIRLALEAVAAAEGIAASEEDFENEVKRIADAYKMEVEKVRGHRARGRSEEGPCREQGH